MKFLAKWFVGVPLLLIGLVYLGTQNVDLTAGFARGGANVVGTSGGIYVGSVSSTANYFGEGQDSAGRALERAGQTP